MRLEIKGRVHAKFDDQYGNLNVIIDDGATKVPVRFSGFSKEECAGVGTGDTVTVKASLQGREKDGKWFPSVEGGACTVTAKHERQPGEDDLAF